MESQQRIKRVAVIGPKKAGEKLTLLSLFHALFIKPASRDCSYPVLSADLRALLGARRNLRKPTEEEVEPVDLPHSLRFDWADGDGGCVVEFVALPASAMYPSGRIDSRELTKWLKAEGYDIVVIVLNPHILWSELGTPAFQRMLLRYMALGRKAEKSAYKFGQVLFLASRAVFGMTEDEFTALNIGWDALPDSVKNLQFTRAHRTRDIAKILEAEGLDADEIAETQRVLDLIVQAACSETGELAIIRDLLKMPHTLLGLTHYDIGEASGITKPEYEQHADTLLPDDRERFRKDIVFLRNVHVELQPPPLDPVYIRDLRPEGGSELWEAGKLHLRAITGRESKPVVPPPLPEPIFNLFEDKPVEEPNFQDAMEKETRLPMPPRKVPVTNWIQQHPKTTLAAIGATLATTIAFVAGGTLIGLFTMIVIWLAAAIVFFANDSRKPATQVQTKTPNIFSKRKDYSPLTKGHAN